MSDERSWGAGIHYVFIWMSWRYGNRLSFRSPRVSHSFTTNKSRDDAFGDSWVEISHVPMFECRLNTDCCREDSYMWRLWSCVDRLVRKRLGSHVKVMACEEAFLVLIKYVRIYHEYSYVRWSYGVCEAVVVWSGEVWLHHLVFNYGSALRRLMLEFRYCCNL